MHLKIKHTKPDYHCNHNKHLSINLFMETDVISTHLLSPHSDYKYNTPTNTLHGHTWFTFVHIHCLLYAQFRHVSGVLFKIIYNHEKART